MDAYRCPYCGSKLMVWDYKNGHIVCEGCGTVIDRIYYDSYDHIDNEDKRPLLKSFEVLKEAEKRISLYLRILKKIRNREKYTVNVESIKLLRKKHVKTIIRKDTLELLEKISNNNDIKQSLKEIDHLYPMLASRTERARIAAAMMLTLLRQGKDPYTQLSNIVQITGISMVHAKRLLKIFKRYKIIKTKGKQ